MKRTIAGAVIASLTIAGAAGDAFLCGELRGKKVKSKAKSKGKSGDKPAAKNKAKGPKAG